MDVYLSEEEQWQRIKDWWKRHGNAVIIAVGLFFILSFGLRYWRVYKIRQKEQASLICSQMLSADLLHKTADSKLFATHLLKDYSSTPYATLAAFILARNSIEKGDLKAGLNELQWVIGNSDNTSFRQIARIRAARILLAQKEYAKAMLLLKKQENDVFDGVVQEVRGDILLAMGRKQEALKMYENIANQDELPILQMKINQLKRVI